MGLLLSNVASGVLLHRIIVAKTRNSDLVFLHGRHTKSIWLGEQCLTNETQASQANVEDKERVDGNADSVFDDTRSSENADSRCQRPCNKDNVNGYPSDHWQAKCAEQGCDDKREQSVSNDANRLEK